MPLSLSNFAEDTSRASNPNADTGPLEASVDALPPLDMFQTDVFHDFDAFISTMGMNLPFEPDLFTTGPCHLPTPAPSDRQEMLMLHKHPAAPRLHPSYQLHDVAAGRLHMEFSHADADELSELKPMPCPWGYSTANREQLQAAVSRCLHGADNVNVPSRLALGRYTAAYFDECYNHFPMIHATTFRPQEVCAICPELILSITAFGAMVKYETVAASRLFDVAKTVALNRWDDLRSSNSTAGLQKLQCIQAVLLLCDFAILQRPPDAMQVTSSLRDVLQEYVRHNFLVTPDHHYDESSWPDWISAERRRRTLYCIFHVLNLYTVTSGLPPALLASELHAQLASSSVEWNAHTQDSWTRHRGDFIQPPDIQDALADLVSTSSAQHLHSPLANLALINALLQRVYLTRQMQFDSREGPLRDADIKDMQQVHSCNVIRCFANTRQEIFEQMDKCLATGPHRSLSTNDPEKVARDLHAAPLPPRTPDIAPALLHATQALYVPVKLGIDWIKRRHFLHWDLSHFLYCLEAAVFLSKWLSSVAETIQTVPLTNCESNILQALHRIVDDTDESLDPFEDGPSLSVGTADAAPSPHFARALAVRVAQVWARLFRDHNSPWAMSILIGKSLNVYARLMREDLEAQNRLPSVNALL